MLRCHAPMRRDLVVIVLIAGAALGIRIYSAWDAVLGGARVNFLETDAWYHLRLVENQVANFPWRVTVDPFAAVGGQFVPVAPLYDTVTAAAVVALKGRGAETESVARIAAFVPPVLGALAVLVAGLLARRVFGARAGWLAAALAAVLPGHFMDRTVLGFVDHHALEALLALATLLAIVTATDRADARAETEAASPAQWTRACVHHGLPGVALGLYLLSWASGALLVAILAVWLVAVVIVSRSLDEIARCARVLLLAALVALAFVLTFQNPGMHRYDTQVIAISGLAATALAIVVTVRPLAGRRLLHTDVVRSRSFVIALLAAAALTSGLALWWLRPDQFSQVLTDAARLTPDPARMGVLEARPLFTYSGEFTWSQPWQFFRSGFYIGIVALVGLAVRIWRQRRADDLLLCVFTGSMFVATIGQNRFGYYLIPACAVIGGWLADRALAVGEPDARARERPNATARGPLHLLPTIAVAGLMFAPALPTNVILQPRAGMFVQHWQDAVDWIARNTPPPFASAGQDDRYYLSRYPRPVPAPDYTVMNWWDQGYYLIQRAHRVPVSNPTQERASISARFYMETDDVRGLAILQAERSRYVLADWELPFRITPEGTIAGRFQTLGNWAGISHADYYEVCYRQRDGDWVPVWIFYEPYYRSLAYRLTVLGGAAATPSNATSVVTLVERREVNGQRFCELVADRPFATYEAARLAAGEKHGGAATTRLAGLDPWQAAFPVPAVASLREVHAVRTAEQKSTETPWVRVFSVQ